VQYCDTELSDGNYVSATAFANLHSRAYPITEQEAGSRSNAGQSAVASPKAAMFAPAGNTLLHAAFGWLLVAGFLPAWVTRRATPEGILIRLS
jgi:hypothetical protein